MTFDLDASGPARWPEERADPWPSDPSQHYVDGNVQQFLSTVLAETE
jgi:hypothetical protein